MNKLKKMLCVGGIALTSVVPLSGCNLLQTNLSDEQIDKLMYALDNADKYMNENLELLEKSNAKLEKEEAYSRFRMAINNLVLNVDDVWSNMLITNSIHGETTKIDRYYKNDGNTYMNWCSGEGTKETFVYTSPVPNGGVVVYEKSSPTANPSKKNGRYFNNKLKDFELYIDMLKEEDILVSDGLDDGSHRIVFYNLAPDEDSKARILFDIIILPDGNFKSIKLIYYVEGESYSEVHSVPIEESTTFEYGVVNGSEMENKFSEVKAYVENQN